MSILGGLGLMLGGGILGALGNRSRRDAMNRMAGAAQRAYGNLATEYQSAFAPIMDRLSSERVANIDLYRQEMGRARDDFTRYFEQAQQQYGAGMERAIGEYRTGRESTIALLRQTIERQQQAQTARNAFSGIGQTSFGASQIQSIGQQGVLQEGAIREQYAAGLSALEAQRAQGLSSISAQMGQGLSGLQQAQAANLSNIYQQYSGNIANMQMAGLSNQFNMRQQGLQVAFGARQQAAGMAGGMTSAFGSALGSIGGSVFGAGLQGFGSFGASGLPAGMDPQNNAYTNYTSGGAVGGR